MKELTALKVWKLHISRQRMLGVLMIFLLGSVAVAASGARMGAMIKVFIGES